MNINVISKNELLTKSHSLLFLVAQSNVAESVDKSFPKEIAEVVHRAIKTYAFDAADQSNIVVPLFNEQVQHIILVGVGGIDTLTTEKIRRAVAIGVKKAESLKVTGLVIGGFDSKTTSMIDVAYEIALVSQMALYTFQRFKTDKKVGSQSLKDLYILIENDQKIAVLNVIEKAKVIGKAINTTRDWVNLPPMVMTPTYLADRAQEVAKAHNLTCTIFSEAEIIRMGMGGLAGVSRGSEEDCKLAILEYKTKASQNAPTIALVGKGITFDSGGLSLKPARAMETMKTDMAGAAAVINVIGAAAQLQVPVNVIAVAPISENLPSGKAIKPGDVITFYNGKTAEVKNTDAEGRLILADALSYAVKQYKVDAIMDIATLTGACAYALGPFYSGLLSQHEDMVARLQRASQISGDYVWRLPMGDDYKRAIKSSIADISNTGDEVVKAGATTAAHFLQHFVADVPWAHLDIAGADFDVPNIPYFGSGATGVGVRLLIQVLIDWNK